MAEARGLVMRVPAKGIRSRRALQAALHAREQGRFVAFDRALYRARFEADLDLSDVAVLKDVALESALDPDALAYAITSGAHLEELNAELQVAARMGIRGVPLVLVGPAAADFSDFLMRAEPVSGAVPFADLDAAIGRALSRSTASG